MGLFSKSTKRAAATALGAASLMSLGAKNHNLNTVRQHQQAQRAAQSQKIARSHKAAARANFGKISIFK